MSRWYALEPDLSTDTASVSCNVGEFLDSWFTTNFWRKILFYEFVHKFRVINPLTSIHV